MNQWRCRDQTCSSSLKHVQRIWRLFVPHLPILVSQRSKQRLYSMKPLREWKEEPVRRRCQYLKFIVKKSSRHASSIPVYWLVFSFPRYKVLTQVSIAGELKTIRTYRRRWQIWIFQKNGNQANIRSLSCLLMRNMEKNDYSCLPLTVHSNSFRHLFIGTLMEHSLCVHYYSRSYTSSLAIPTGTQFPVCTVWLLRRMNWCTLE